MIFAYHLSFDSFFETKFYSRSHCNIGVNSGNLTICIKLYFIVITFGFGLIILFEGGAGHEKQLIKPIRVLNCRRLLTMEKYKCRGRHFVGHMSVTRCVKPV